MNKFYLTTTIPYVNADPHIGHALEFIQADAIIRHKRRKLGKENVFFNVGTDEYGLKIYTKAKEKGQDTKEYVDFYAKRFKDFCELFHISYDNFYRTSEPGHAEAAQEFWRRCDANGDIYKKKYEGLYCVGCESFKTEKDLIDGKCPDHGVEPIWFSEENYFFRLSRYQDLLLKLLDDNPDFIQPTSKTAEWRNFILGGLEDISISRLKKNLPWGIDVPNDPEQVLYVWFDALTNYITAVGFPNDEEKFNNFWPAVQICGPDNLRFQAGIWQAMLASAKLPFSKKILVHGTILGEDGKKMSKTIGNVVSPYEQADKYGSEAVRFYLLSSLPTFSDSSYKEDDLKESYNSNLADKYGNLLSRVIHLANQKNIEINKYGEVTADFKQEVDELAAKADEAYDEYELHDAIQFIIELSSLGNKYIDENKPWDKSATTEKISEVLNNLSYLLFKLNDLYEPIVPVSVQKAKDALEKREQVVLFPKIA